MKKLPRILVVEDEPAIAELIAVNLRHNGFAPTVVYDGAAARREIDAVLPDVILLDWMLPGESGGQEASGNERLDTATPKAYFQWWEDGKRVASAEYTRDELVAEIERKERVGESVSEFKEALKRFSLY